MSSGGGGGNGMMMAMMMQQQQAQQAAMAQQQMAAQAESARQFDATQAYNAQQAQVAAQQYAAQQAQQQQQYADSRADSQSYAAQQSSAQDKAAQAAMAQLQAQQQFQMQQVQDQRNYEAQQAAQAKADQQAKLDSWNTQRGGLYTSSLNDALSQLAGMGDTDANDVAAVKQAYSGVNGSLADMQNLSGIYDGLAQKTFGNLTAQKQAGFNKTYNSLFPTGFDTTKIADTTDDDILNSIMQSQYDDAASQAQRLLQRGTITQEGYDANIKALGNQKAGANSKLTTLGNNELSSERSNINNLINQGRSDISNYQLGQSFDPNSYVSKVNSAYDSWFSGLGDKLKGLAPTDLFDTSNFLNTAGSVAGPTNSPFVGSTNALTGANALSTTDDDPTKKKSSNALGSPVQGVF